MILDPLTLVVAAAVVLWIRNVAVDAWAFARREESPRIAHQREKRRLRDGRPTLADVVADRAVTRLANPPEHRFLRPLREYFAVLWADSLSDSLARHELRRSERAQRDGTTATEPRALVARPCTGTCNPRRLVTYDGLCGPCERAAAEAERQPEPQPEPEQEPQCATCHKRPVARAGDHCDGCLGADRAHETGAAPVRLCGTCHTPLYSHEPGPDCGPCQVAAAARAAASEPAEPADDLDDLDDDPTDTQPIEIPEPTPAPDSHQEGHTPMTAPNIISGDIGSPREAVDFCDGNQQVNTAATDALHTAIANLGSQGIGVGFLNVMADPLAPIEQAGMAVDEARGQYLEHVRVQAELLADPDLRDTLLGYLNSINA